MSTRLEIAGTEVLRIGLGTNRLTNAPRNVAFVKQAVSAGVGMIDTAHLYAGGESEETIGAALTPAPERCVVATKGGYRPGEGRPEALRDQIEESLRRLRTGTIALYYLHRVDPRTRLVEESLAVIGEFRDRGTIRQVGISAVGVEEIERARRVVPIAAVQNPYNLAERRYEEVVDYCAREGIVFVAYYPLHGIAPAADEIAARHGATSEQIALAWLLRRSPVILPIPGTLSLDHLRQNLVALEIELSDAEFKTLI
jgi:pyridoxine 4-dehydrogenase